MSKTQNPKVYFALAGITVFCGAGFLFLQKGSIDSLRNKVVTLRQKAEEQKHIGAKLDSSKKALSDLQTQLSHLEQGLPDAAYVPTMLKELEAFGKQQGIEIMGLRPLVSKNAANASSKDKDKEQPKPYEQLDLELKGRGKYSNLVSFVESLNQFPKIVAAHTVTIAPDAKSKQTNDGTLDVTMNLRAFLFKQQDPTQDLKKADGGAA